MARIIYRDSCGRFAAERHASFKHTEGRHFIWLFNKWAELKPITSESFRSDMARYNAAMQRAL